MSGMSSRLHNAARLAFPLYRAQVAVLKLFSICIALDFPQKVLIELLLKHSRCYRAVYLSLVGTIRHSIQAGSCAGVSALIDAVRSFRAVGQAVLFLLFVCMLAVVLIVLSSRLPLATQLNYFAFLSSVSVQKILKSSCAFQ